ncbi:MAG: amidase family protein, partial [Rhodospirillales bacterium]|nr:amidase family protein [Rhodospirillales bacterium]
MPTGPVPPSAKKVQELAESFGFTMSDADADLYSEMMAGTLNSYRRLDAMQETKPPVKYPRAGSYRPGPEEDPYNAWYVKGEIKGAADGVLAGKRVGIKDAICVAGFPMINGAKGMEGYIPDIDATVVTRVLDAGGTILGKTNSEDCSFSGGSHTSAYGPVRNPHKPTHSTGASSNGNGAAVAAGDVDATIGGDQGGSIRIPASWSGIVGLKPTYGLVPYTGAMMI